MFGERRHRDEGKGRPKKPGHKMKLSDSTTWEIPIESIEINDPTWGVIEIQRWRKFHFYNSPDHPMEIILIQRTGKGLSQRAAKPMWLAWSGAEKLSLTSLWSFYLRLEFRLTDPDGHTRLYSFITRGALKSDSACQKS